MSTEIKKIASNGFWLFLAEISNSLIGFVVAIYLARDLGSNGYGILGFAISLVTMFSILVDAGLNILSVREIAKDKSKLGYFIKNSSYLRLSISLLVLILLIAVAILMGKNSEIIYLVIILGLWMVANSLAGLFHSAFRALQKMQYEALAKIIQAIVFLGGILIIVYFSGSLLKIGGIYLLSALVGLGVSLIFYKIKAPKYQAQVSLAEMKKIISLAWPFAVTFIFVNLYYYIDSILLSYFQDNQTVGYYTAAYKIILLLITVRTLLTGAIFPSLTQAWQISTSKVKELLEIFEKLSITLITPIVVGGIILAQPIIILIFGDEFIRAYLPFSILLIGIGVMYINLLLPDTLLVMDKQKTVMWVFMISAIFNLIANLLLIPYWGMTGAALTTVISELIIFWAFYFYLKKIIKFKLFTFLPKPLIASAGMGVVIYLLQPQLHVIWLIIIGAIIYTGLIILIGGISLDFIKLNIRLIKKHD